jgi:hypothetical protein
MYRYIKERGRQDTHFFNIAMINERGVVPLQLNCSHFDGVVRFALNSKRLHVSFFRRVSLCVPFFC